MGMFSGLQLSIMINKILTDRGDGKETDMLDTKQFGKRIALLRKESGMSQEKLAELLCISSQAISKWENGHTMPEISLLPILAQIFQCSIDEIIMPAYLFEAEIEEKKPAKMDLQARHIADYIIQQLGGAELEEGIGLDDAAIMEAVRVGICTEDLAMLLALHIEPDREHAKPLLSAYAGM